MNYQDDELAGASDVIVVKGVDNQQRFRTSQHVLHPMGNLRVL